MRDVISARDAVGKEAQFLSAEPLENPLMGNLDLGSCSKYASSKIVPVTSDESNAKQLELLE
ncbi:unnamed protein product [Parascedosporium putredinis]|uniref:Uncharacterized protein n=1 Tax=Parascedosporium putredinis TaxID=1442378 RepID=A0A9P1GW19_9PEZI|nr:unnamed protein product [Parascedosporium putredinis]CAI7988434.1 unnamed protein product [Parascedosporium putredinis]